MTNYADDFLVDYIDHRMQLRPDVEYLEQTIDILRSYPLIDSISIGYTDFLKVNARITEYIPTVRFLGIVQSINLKYRRMQAKNGD